MKTGDIIIHKNRPYGIMACYKDTSVVTAENLDDIRTVNNSTIENDIIVGSMDMCHDNGGHKFVHELNDDIKNQFPEYYL